MSDKYPDTLIIEIDRDPLRNYLRAKWLLAWALPLLFFGVMFSFSSIDRAFRITSPTGTDVILLVSKCIVTGIGISLLVTLLCYLIFSHRIASRLASSLQVSVEGAFFHVRQHAFILSDRKLHFRSIVDYAITQDFLMRYFGIHALQMTTTAGGQNTNLVIPGVKNCLSVRDTLADIDRLRETQ